MAGHERLLLCVQNEHPILHDFRHLSPRKGNGLLDNLIQRFDSFDTDGYALPNLFNRNSQRSGLEKHPDVPIYSLVREVTQK